MTFWQNWRGKRLEQGCLQRNKDIYLIDVKKNNKMFKSFLNKKKLKLKIKIKKIKKNMLDLDQTQQ